MNPKIGAWLALIGIAGIAAIAPSAATGAAPMPFSLPASAANSATTTTATATQWTAQCEVSSANPHAMLLRNINRIQSVAKRVIEDPRCMSTKQLLDHIKEKKYCSEIEPNTDFNFEVLENLLGNDALKVNPNFGTENTLHEELDRLWKAQSRLDTLANYWELDLCGDDIYIAALRDRALLQRVKIGRRATRLLRQFATNWKDTNRSNYRAVVSGQPVHTEEALAPGRHAARTLSENFDSIRHQLEVCPNKTSLGSELSDSGDRESPHTLKNLLYELIDIGPLFEIDRTTLKHLTTLFQNQISTALDYGAKHRHDDETKLKLDQQAKPAAHFITALYAALKEKVENDRAAGAAIDEKNKQMRELFFGLMGEMAAPAAGGAVAAQLSSAAEYFTKELFNDAASFSGQATRINNQAETFDLLQSLQTKMVNRTEYLSNLWLPDANDTNGQLLKRQMFPNWTTKDTENAKRQIQNWNDFIIRFGSARSIYSPGTSN